MVGTTAGAAGANEVGADAMLKGLFGEVNGLGGGVGAFCAEAGVHDGAVVRSTCAGAGADDGANENGELGELKIDGTTGFAGAAGAAGGGAAGGLVNGSGYSGIELAAAENGFGGGMYCDCWAGCHSGVNSGAAGASGVSSAFSCPGGGGTRPSATRRGSSIPC